MFNKSDLERTLYARVGPEAGNSLKNFAKVGAVASALYVIPKAAAKLAAYGFVDNNGKYFCDPQHLNLEKIQYKTVVDGINSAIANYESSVPGSTDQQIHNAVMGLSNYGQNYTDIMYKMQDCLNSNGIDPNSVAQISKDVAHAIAVPEFGPIAATIAAAGIFVGMIASRYLGKSGTGRN